MSENNSIDSDLPKCISLLSEYTSNISNVGKTIQVLIEKIKNKELNTNDGFSLLELKNLAFASYITHLSFTSLLKLSGKKLEGKQCIDNLVELRVLLERIKPIEAKAKFQIDKYLTNESSNVKKDDSNKISLDNIGDSSDEEQDDETEQDGGKRTKLYKAPKISQVHYPDENRTDKVEAKLQRDRNRLLNSDMMRDALQEFTEDPEVIHNSNADLKAKVAEKKLELQRYEEDNFIRVSLSKKDKASMRQMGTSGNLAKELLSFRSLEAQGSSKGGKKRKNNTATKGNKKRKFK